jgi:hypothetical protein
MVKFEIGDRVVIKSTGEVTSVVGRRPSPVGNYYYEVASSSFDDNYYFYAVDLRPVGPEEVGATKFDEGKPDLSLVHPLAVNAIARALGFGACKYTRNGYKGFKKEDLKRVYAALLRHTFAIISGEEFDSESGLRHLDHIAANVAMLAYLEDKHGNPDFN